MKVGALSSPEASQVRHQPSMTVVPDNVCSRLNAVKFQELLAVRRRPFRVGRCSFLTALKKTGGLGKEVYSHPGTFSPNLRARGRQSGTGNHRY